MRKVRILCVLGRDKKSAILAFSLGESSEFLMVGKVHVDVAPFGGGKAMHGCGSFFFKDFFGNFFGDVLDLLEAIFAVVGNIKKDALVLFVLLVVDDEGEDALESVKGAGMATDKEAFSFVF